jgi:hypothetical protein
VFSTALGSAVDCNFGYPATKLITSAAAITH